MIKTKTPRNWGGGIRQVSPPMLTSRLSNIGRWRTNEWKDYSRSRRNCERFWVREDGRIARICWDWEQSQDCRRFYSKSYTCKFTKRIFWISNQALHRSYFGGIFDVTFNRLERKFGYIQHKQFNIYSNSPRLTLKGVA